MENWITLLHVKVGDWVHFMWDINVTGFLCYVYIQLVCIFILTFKCKQISVLFHYANISQSTRHRQRHDRVSLNLTLHWSSWMAFLVTFVGDLRPELLHMVLKTLFVKEMTELWHLQGKDTTADVFVVLVVNVKVSDSYKCGGNVFDIVLFLVEVPITTAQHAR